MEAPIPINEAERQAALDRYRVIDTAPEEVFDEITRMAAAVCDVPIALVSLLDHGRQWFKSRYGIETPEMPREISFCGHAILQEGVFVVDDAAEDRRFQANPLVTGEPGIRFYAGVPLRTDDGQGIGSLCVIDRTPRRLSEKQVDTLRSLGRQVIVRLEHRLRVRSFLDLAERLSGAGDVRQVCESLAQVSWGVFRSAVLRVWVFDAHERVFRLAYQRKGDAVEAGLFLSGSEIAAGWPAALELQRSGCGLYAAPTSGGVGWDGLIGKPSRKTGRVVAAIEGGDGQPLILISSLHSDNGVYRDEDMELMRGLAGYCGGAIKRLQAEVEGGKMRDRYDRAIQGSTDAIWDWERVASDEVWWSPRFSEMLGFEPKNVRPSVTLFESLLHPDDREGTAAALRSHLEERAPCDVEFRLRTMRGDYRWFRARGQARWDGDGAPLSMSGTVQDVHEQKLTNEALEKARNEAEAASRAKGQFLANMSHEIRTPMNAIIGLTELALETRLDNGQRRYLNSVKRSAEDLLGLLDDVLDLSNIESGDIALASDRFSLEESLVRFMRPLGMQAAEKGMEICLGIEESTPDRLVGDVACLRQVLAGLVDNAIKFSDRGDVRIEVSRAEERGADAGRARLHFVVVDEGIGIPADQREAIFNVFTQADGTTSRRHGGAGLGLSICRKLVERMGGRIWVCDNHPSGSQIHFDSLFGLDAGRPESGFREGALSGMKLLVADDNDGARSRMVALMERNGATVETAESGEAAVERALNSARSDSERPFDAAFVDAGLQRSRNEDVVDVLARHKGLELPVVLLLNSVAQLGKAARFHAHGASDWLVKPFSSVELLAVVEEIRQRADGATEALQAAARDESRRGAFSVLLVEDNPVNREVATRQLASMGHQVDVAVNGEDALRQLTTGAYDVTLMDIQMPVMDGLEAIRLLREWEVGDPERGHAWIIALTAHAMKADKDRCYSAGADDYLAKPLNRGALASALERRREALETSGADRQRRVVDLDSLLSELSGSREVVASMVAAHFKHDPGVMAELTEAVGEGAWERARDLAHRLKGSAAQFHAWPAFESIAALEKAADDARADDAETHLGRARREFDLLDEALRAFSVEGE